MKASGAVSAKLPTTIATLDRLGMPNFTDSEIAYLTTAQGRGKPSAIGATAREKFQRLYVAAEAVAVREKVAAHSPKNVLKETQEMFKELLAQASYVVDHKDTGFIVAGAPGIGKTFVLEKYFESKLNTKNDRRFRKVPAGHMTPVNLYMNLYRNRMPGQVLLIDDNDEILEDSASLNLLKGALGTDPRRSVAWMSETSSLKGETEDTDIPKEFDYEGSLVFISNLNLRAMSEGDRGRHLRAVLDRVTYIDLKLHDRRQVLQWVLHGISETGVLDIYFKSIGESKWRGSYNKDVADFIAKHGPALRSLSYRGAIRIAERRLRNPSDWAASSLRTEQ